MPEARHNNSKLAEMFDRASRFNALVGIAVDVVSLFMALLSFVESAPRAYRLKASNAASPISTSVGSTSCKADDCLWVQVPSDQSRSGQIGIESCGRRGNAR